jgi:peptide deformylase
MLMERGRAPPEGGFSPEAFAKACPRVRASFILRSEKEAMTVLHIVKYGDPVLRQKAEPVAGPSPELSRLVQDMIETMYAARGVGLAAPQVGAPIRLFVADPFHEDGNRASRSPLVFINPKVVEESVEDDEMEEGCLSMPGVNADVFRAVKVSARALDRDFHPFEVAGAKGLLARVILHEIDHLDGRFFTDSLPEARRRALLPELTRIKKLAREDSARLEKLADVSWPAPASLFA